jgi:hypothetical protein
MNHDQITDNIKASFLLDHYREFEEHLEDYEYMPCAFTLKESGVIGIIQEARACKRTDKALEEFYDSFSFDEWAEEYIQEDKNTKGCEL